MSRVLYEAKAERIMTGFRPDLKGRNAPLWVDGQNMVLDHGEVHPVPAQKLFIAEGVSGTVLGIASAQLGSVPSVFWGTSGKLFRWTATGGTVLEGSGFSGKKDSEDNNPCSMWTFERWGTWMVASNGVNAIQIFKTATGDFAALATSAAPARAEIIIGRTPHVVALNTDAGIDIVEWCAEDNIESWVTGLGKTAGNLQIRGLKGPIRAAKKLAGEIVFYTETSQHMLYYGGLPFRFREQLMSDKIGACGKQAVVAIGNEHFGMDTKKVWRSSGNGWRNISDEHVTKWIFEDFNEAQRSKVAIQHVDGHDMIAIYFPSAGSLVNDRCALYNYVHDYWNPPATFARTSADQDPGLQWLLSGNSSGYIFDWSDRSTPASSDDAGQLPLDANATHFLGWGYGGWGLFPWGGPTISVEG